jgi:hypothetical protein
MSSLLVFKRVYRLEIDTVSHVVISTQLCELMHAPLPSLQFTSTSPPPCVNKYRSIHTVYAVCNREWGRGSGCVESIYRSYTLCI